MSHGLHAKGRHRRLGREDRLQPIPVTASLNAAGSGDFCHHSTRFHIKQQQLARPRAAHADLSICIMDALRVLGGAPQRAIVERFTLNPGLPPPVRAAAARNLGHLGGTSEDRYWIRAINLHSRLALRHQSPASGATLRGLVYGLGMARNDPLLARIRDRPEMPWQARAAASWWLGHPRRIRESAAV